MEINERLQQLFVQEPKSPVVYFGEQTWTWRDVSRIADDIHALLERAGVDEKKGIGLILRQGPEAFCAMLALFSLRRCVVPITPVQPDRSVCEELEHLLLAAVIASGEDWQRHGLKDVASNVGTAGLSLPAGSGQSVEFIAGLEQSGTSLSYQPGDGVAVTMLTSGTTGKPKRIPASYRLFDRETPPPLKPVDERGVSIGAVPLATVGGITGAVNSVWRGRPTALMHRFDVWRWAEMVRKYQPRHLVAPPAVLRMLLDQQVPPEYLDSAEVFAAGSAPLDESTLEEFEAVYDIQVLRIYGATEFLGAVTAFPPAQRHLAKVKKGSVGKAVPSADIRIVDAETGEEVPTGTIGILEADPSKRSADAERGWMRTNDLARMDEDGYIWIEGRTDGVIVRGGFKVSSDELASVLCKHPSVAEAAAVGIENPRLNQVPVAAVVLKQGRSAAIKELQAWVRERKPGYWVPVQIKFVESLPRNQMMKIVPSELKALFID